MARSAVEQVEQEVCADPSSYGDGCSAGAPAGAAQLVPVAALLLVLRRRHLRA